MIARALCIGLLVLGSLARAAGDERAHIVAERAAANAKFAEQERECGRHFVVSACVDAVRKEQRATLARLRQEEMQLDESARREAAAARRMAIDAKVETQQQKASDPVATEPTPASSARHTPQARPRVPASTAPRSAPPAASGSASASQRRETEARNAASFDARARAAQAHRESVERRNALRAAEGKKVAPLPSPPSASAAAR